MYQHRIVEYLQNQPAATQKELQEAFSETRTHIQKNMKELVNEGKIELEGGKDLDIGKSKSSATSLHKEKYFTTVIIKYSRRKKEYENCGRYKCFNLWRVL